MPKKIMQTIAAMAEIHNRQLSTGTIQLLVMDLSDYSPELVLKALSRCRKELSRFPTLSDILERIEDGRPGVEEAWAMIPKTESESVVWTLEMREAYSAMRSLIHDPVAARMAFKETYTKALLKSRNEKQAVTWEVSLGHDLRQRDAVLLEAVRKNRLALEYVRKLIPELPAPEVRELVHQNLKQITEVKK